MQLQLTTTSLIILLLLAGTLLSSCRTRNVQLETSKTASEFKFIADSSSAIRVKADIKQHSLSWTDEQGSYQVSIVPEGEFTFHPSTGFKGKAKSISVAGIEKRKQMDSSELHTKSDSIAKTSSNTEIRNKQNAASKDKNVQATGPAFPWLWLLAMIPLYFVLRFIKPFIDYIRESNRTEGD